MGVWGRHAIACCARRPQRVQGRALAVLPFSPPQRSARDETAIHVGIRALQQTRDVELFRGASKRQIVRHTISETRVKTDVGRYRLPGYHVLKGRERGLPAG